MELQIVKHSFCAAFASVETNAACIADGKYTRVWFNKDGSTVVKTNTVGTNSKLVTGKKAAAIVGFVQANLEATK